MLLLFLLAWGCARNDPLLVEGQQHFYNREYQAAIEVLQRAVQGPSPSRAVYRYLGRCYLQVGQYEQARETARAGLVRAPNDPELYDLLGAIEMTRAFAEARYSDTDAALRAFQRAIELDPQRATTHYNLGLVYSYRDSAHRAERAYLAALQVDSTLAPAHKKLGLYYRRQGTLDQALSHLQRAVQYAPEDAEAHFHRGLLLRAQGHYDQAVAALERAAALNPYSPQVHFNLSQLYLRTGQRERGEKALARSEILRQHHRGIGSEQSLPEVSAVAIGSSTARYNLALHLALQGQYDQAILEYQNALAINPELKDAHSSLGVLFTYQGDLPAAAESFRQALALDEEDPLSHARLGMTLLKQQRYVEARASLLRAAALDSSLHEAAYGLGLAAARTGDLAGGRRPLCRGRPAQSH